MKTGVDAVSVRNLERIQEEERGSRSPKLATAVMAALAAGALITAGVMTLGRSTKNEESKRDPLADLVQKSKAAPDQKEDGLRPSQATFAARLTDSPEPTTALAAVKNERGELLSEPAELAAAPMVPPSAGDRLPVVPLPAGTLLQSTTVTSAPADDLTRLAAEKSRPELIEIAPAGVGSEGGYQIQVASFRDQVEADSFVAELQKRGHKTYRQAAYVPERGLWHRVRIGPFKHKFQAAQYQAEFEQKERMATFLVDPEKVEKQKQARAEQLAVRAAEPTD
ncbi:MAG TPA: SPOR domain-containing protein [Polyangiaceae bacterium]|nr:SPOR domain-containing protein [Polyangiaceae bacterium]